MKHLAALAALLIGCGSSEQESSQPDGGTSGASGAGATSSNGGSSGASGAGATGGAAGSMGGAAGSTGGAAGSTGGAAGSGGALPSGPYRRVFYDGFEGNFSSEWDQDGSRDLCVVASSSLDALHGPKAGGGMLRCNWNGDVAWNDPASYETLRLDGFSHTKEVLFRFWLRADANTDPKDGAKIYRWGTNGSFGGLDFSAGSQTAAFHGTSGQIGTTFWGGGSELASGAWHEVEVYVKYGESDGEARLWEDGKMLWEAVSVDTTQDGGNISPFHLMSNWSSNPGWEHDAQNHVYWDEFEVYADSASGSQAAGSLADGSAHL